MSDASNSPTASTSPPVTHVVEAAPVSTPAAEAPATSTPVPTEPPTLESTSRERLATYTDYAQAQKVVDVLSDAGFPVAGVAIVGVDLRLVETVTARLTVAKAALYGAGSGAWWGLAFGTLLGLFSTNFWGAVLWGLGIGAIFGAVFGAMAHSASRGTRDFSSFQQLAADRYEVLVPADQIARAREVLHGAAPQRDVPVVPEP